jgi:nucleoside-diphosphate-sugar epimerase
MGTVCGYSPKLRSELIFNAMNISALEKKLVNVTNKKSFRTILFLDDLLCTVLDQLKTQRTMQKFLNVGSLNLSIGELANTIAEFYGVPVIDHGDTETYSFSMDFELCSQNSLRPDLVRSQCLKFKEAYQK